MELSGKIIQKFPLQSGESKTSGKPWQLQAYLLETQEQYARKVYSGSATDVSGSCSERGDLRSRCWRVNRRSAVLIG